MPINHLAILGMSFTGSTIISYALGALPQCSNVDESHWLVDNAAVFCCHCGPTCKVWTAEKREALRSSNRFYTDLREALGAEVLISADKDPDIYRRLEPCERRSYLMLYRDPIAQSKSAMKAAEREGSSTDLSRFLDYWVDKNIAILAETTALGGNLLLNLADFQLDPETTIRKLARWFGLKYSNDWLRYWEIPQHSIGGNFNPYSYVWKGEIEKAMISPTNVEPMPNHHRDSVNLMALLDNHRANIRHI